MNGVNKRCMVVFRGKKLRSSAVLQITSCVTLCTSHTQHVVLHFYGEHVNRSSNTAAAQEQSVGQYITFLHVRLRMEKRVRERERDSRRERERERERERDNT